MKFKCQYKKIFPATAYAANSGEVSNSYWRSVDADSESEANMLANRMARKGYRLILLVQDNSNINYN